MAADIAVPQLGERVEVEQFATFLARDLEEECLTVLLLPWSGAAGEKPDKVVAPVAGDPATVSAHFEAEIQRVIGNRELVVVPCNFATQLECTAAEAILPQLISVPGACVFLVHVYPPGLVLTRETANEFARLTDLMIETGIDDVLVNPEANAESLKRSLSVQRVAWQTTGRRVQMLLESEPGVAQGTIDQLTSRHQHLLWDNIPRLLMPQLPLVDSQLLEDVTRIGVYGDLRVIETMGGGTVLRAVNAQQECCVIKVVDKSVLIRPDELECIYREYRFLSDIVRHPNVSRCIDILHSPKRLHLVFEFGGRMNLLQMAAERPGQRLEEEESLECFTQVASALAHAHSVDVAHRCVTFEHVVVERVTGGRPHCRLIDFRGALVARNTTTSRAVVGGLPCIAPEMALRRLYVPRLVDCWSLGIVLLEMAAGLYSLSRAVPFNQDGSIQTAAQATQDYFLRPGSQAHVLALQGAVTHPGIISRLESLVRTDPSQRSPMAEMAQR